MNGSRIALFGGSFDPPHVGHLLAAAYVRAVAGVDGVWLLPAANHPFGKPLTPFEQRVALCQAMVQPLKGVAVSRVEAEPGLDGKTVHTVARLQALYPDHRFSLVIGTDILNDVHRWFEFDRLVSMVDFIVLRRSGYSGTTQTGPLSKATFLSEVSLPEVSSTEIRRRLQNSESAAGLVPEAVLREIERLGMYR